MSIRLLLERQSVIPTSLHFSPCVHLRSPASRFLLLALLFFEAVLFGLFTCAMLTEQLRCVPCEGRVLHDARCCFPHPATFPAIPVHPTCAFYLRILPAHASYLRMHPTCACILPTHASYLRILPAHPALRSISQRPASSILSDQTGIERIKHDYQPQRQRTTLHSLSDTFGRPFSLLWLLPTAVKFNGLTFRDMMPMECEV